MAMQPKCGQSGYIAPTVSGSPMLNRGGKSRTGYAAQMWTKPLHHPCRLTGPQRSARGEKAKMAMHPKCGQSGYISPALSGVPNTRHGTKKHNGYMAKMCIKRPHHPCRVEEPQRSTRGEKAEMAVQPKCGQSGSISPAVTGVPNARRGENKRNWLCTRNEKKAATSPLPSRGSPTLGAGRKSRKWVYGANVDKVATSCLPSQGSPTLNTGRKRRHGYAAQM